jgi:hypothetical protein
LDPRSPWSWSKPFYVLTLAVPLATNVGWRRSRRSKPEI